MKKVFCIVLSMLCLLGCSFAGAVTPGEDNHKIIEESESNYSNMINEVTQKCYDGYGQNSNSKNMNGYLFSKCYRDEVNKNSISKIQACSDYSDGLHLDPIQYSRNFSSSHEQSKSLGFFKFGTKLYYTVEISLDAADGSNDGNYFYEYNCQTKKAKSLIHYGSSQREKYHLQGGLPLWVDKNGSDSYHLAGGQELGDIYNPISIIKINLKTKKATTYNIFSDIQIDENSIKTYMPSSFKWLTPLSWFTDTYEKNYGSEAEDPKKGFIRLHNIAGGVGYLNLITDKYLISLDVDFNKKTIK